LDSATFLVAATVACVAIGVFGLPLFFAGVVTVGVWVAWVWLLIAAILSVIVLFLLPRLTLSLSALLLGVGNPASVTPSQTRLIARLFMIGVALLVTQAMVRQPLGSVVGRPVEVEAAVAAAALVWPRRRRISRQFSRPVVAADPARRHTHRRQRAAWLAVSTRTRRRAERLAARHPLARHLW
jgi:hypothetical protein